MSDFPNSTGGAGSVRYINPDSLNNNPAFTNVVVVEGNVKTVHIGGQDAINASGEIVGKGDIVAQTEQILRSRRPRPMSTPPPARRCTRPRGCGCAEGSSRREGCLTR